VRNWSHGAHDVFSGFPNLIAGDVPEKRKLQKYKIITSKVPKTYFHHKITSKLPKYYFQITKILLPSYQKNTSRARGRNLKPSKSLSATRGSFRQPSGML
jgi:hypothetical protein